MLVLLILVFILFAHWFACIWYSIGNTELNSGVTYGWLQTLAAVTKQPFKPSNTSASSDYTEGPSTEMRYLTALYFTLSCMTGVGFGNVSANTQTEKLFSVFMMIIGCKLCTGSFFFFFSILSKILSHTRTTTEEEEERNQENNSGHYTRLTVSSLYLPFLISFTVIPASHLSL